MAEFLRVRNAAELAIGDVVLTPSQRHAEVRGHRGGRVCVAYIDDHGRVNALDGCDLHANWLRLVRKAVPVTGPSRAFFAGADAVRVGR